MARAASKRTWAATALLQTLGGEIYAPDTQGGRTNGAGWRQRARTGPGVPAAHTSPPCLRRSLLGRCRIRTRCGASAGHRSAPRRGCRSKPMVPNRVELAESKYVVSKGSCGRYLRGRFVSCGRFARFRSCEGSDRTLWWLRTLPGCLTPESAFTPGHPKPIPSPMSSRARKGCSGSGPSNQRPSVWLPKRGWSWRYAFSEVNHCLVWRGERRPLTLRCVALGMRVAPSRPPSRVPAKRREGTGSSGLPAFG
jgi:hypothetical protein